MKPGTLLIALGLAFSLGAWADRIDELTRRIEELEKQQADILLNIQEPRPNVNAFLDDNLTFGGYFEPGYTVIAGEDTDLQAATANILALNIAADYGSKFRFSAQTLSVLAITLQNPHNDPRGEGPSAPGDRQFSTPVIASTLVQGYVEYRMSRALNLQVGLGHVPFNYSFQERELILFHRRGGPQMLRFNPTISALWEGIQLYGSFPISGNSWGYNVYTYSPPQKLTALGTGGRLWWASPNEFIVTGVSAQVGKGENETFESVGADVKLEKFPWIVRSEYFQTVRDESDPWSIYVEPAVYLGNEEYLLYVFGDYLFNSMNETNGIIADPFQRWEYGGGINWLPTTFTRFRFGVTYADYVGKTAEILDQERDHWIFDISAGVAF